MDKHFPVDKQILLDLANKYNDIDFIDQDPIQIPHLFTNKKDIEIAGFLTSVFSWGRRDQILIKAKDLMKRMDHQPFAFILSEDWKNLENWQYRTFMEEDLRFFMIRLNEIYREFDDLEQYFSSFVKPKEDHYNFAISRFKEDFFKQNPTHRSTKHLPNPQKGSAAKRFNMFLRWMVRNDTNGVDFGIWSTLEPQKLSCPLDTHTGRIAREFGLLHRKQNDFKALLELDQKLRTIHPEDPAILDFALFGYGIEHPKNNKTTK
jgi:uncharacterized protein (TIGR02757 family)